MKHLSFPWRRVALPLLATGGWLCAAHSAAAQAPVLTNFSPVRNAVAVPRGASVALTFSQAIAAASAGNVRVFSAQRGGQLVRAGGGTVSGGGTNTVAFDPGTDFRPGETVFVTVPPTVVGAGGAAAWATPRRPWRWETWMEMATSIY